MKSLRQLRPIIFFLSNIYIWVLTYLGGIYPKSNNILRLKLYQHIYLVVSHVEK